MGRASAASSALCSVRGERGGMDALGPSGAGVHRPAFLRLQGQREKLMGDQQPTSDDAAWVKMQIDMAVTKEKVDAVRGIREDLRNVYATKTELKDVAEDVAGLKS